MSSVWALGWEWNGDEDKMPTSAPALTCENVTIDDQ